MRTKRFGDLELGDRIVRDDGKVLKVLDSPRRGRLRGHLSVKVKPAEEPVTSCQMLPDAQIQVAL